VSFLKTVEKARDLLERNGRVSLRALQREFNLDDGALDELIEELAEVQRVAVRDGSILAWASGVPPARTETPEHERAPLDYTPKHLADKILQAKSALEGERKQVTVLFADVKGSMKLSEQIDPEEWHRILERFFEILTEGVHRFEGTVNQYTGDGIMALFGAPIAHEDHAQRACYAALHLRDGLRSLRDELRLSRGIDFQVRIGVNSGEVVVGKIGDDLRMDYTAQGHTVGLAARMEQVAAANTICVSEPTERLVSGYFELRDLGASSVKGASEPVRVFELEGIGPAQTRFEISRARGLTRFVGRDDDLSTLETALSHAQEGHGQVVGVVAEAGVGKSRLCFEFLEHCRAQGMRVLEGRAAAHGRNVPLLPILQVFGAYFGITELDDDRLVREKIAGRMLLFDEEYRRVLPLLFDFFGAPDPDNPAPRMEADARQRQLFGVLGRVAQRDSSQGSIVTLIEDLHWLDGASEAWLAEWVDAIAGSQNLLLVNFRPEYHAEWMQKSWYHQLPLAPLGPDATRELLDHLLGDDPSIAGLSDAIHARTGGNPFFTEEVVRSLWESGHLEETKGSYRLVTPIERLDVPPAVQSVLAARIDRLAEREKQLLQTASVIGDEFAEPVLDAVAKLPTSDLIDALGNLKSAEFIRELSLFPAAEYAFKHPLTRQVAYESQLSERKAEIHAGVARVLEEQSQDKLDQRAAVLAHHWERAGDPLTAARWHARAAAWAGLNHPSEGLTHLRRVRELLIGVPDSAEAQQLGLQARGQLLFHGWRQGMGQDEVRALFAEGRALAEKLGDPAAQIGFLMQGVPAFMSTGLVEEGREVAAEVVRLTEASGQPALKRMGILVSVIKALNTDVDLEEVLRSCDRFLALGHPSDPPMGPLFATALVSVLKARALTGLGRLDAAASALERAVVEAREADQLPALATAHAELVRLAERRGDPELALRNGLRAVEIEEEVGSRAGLMMAYAALGKAWRLKGDATRATAALDREIALAREHGVGMHGVAIIAGGLFSVSSVLLDLAQIHLAGGDAQAARSAVDEALARAHRSDAKLEELPAQLVLARTLLASASQESGAEIDVALERVEALIRQTGAVVYQPDLHEVRAEAARRFGDAASAEQELRMAHRLYNEMGATGHVERVGRELGL
jgi:predicted ATPase/class 3 adenylate cyclase